MSIEDKRIKRNFQEWYDREVLEINFQVQDQFWKNYKKSRLDLEKNSMV